MTAPQSWRKSSFSLANGDCVEVAVTADAVAVRDSKNPAGPMLEFPASTLTAWDGCTHPIG
jgi:hypothetical protein